MLIFDYKGDDYSSDAFLKKVDGKCYSFNFPFNPLKLVATDKTKFMNLPAVTADRISDSFAKAYGLGQVQQSTIKQVILETYQNFGITSNPSTWSKPQPTMNNVVDKYFEQYDAKDKTYALFDKLRDYMIFTPDNSECVSLFEWLDGVKVIDLTPYPGDTKKVIVSLILDLFYEEMRQFGASKLDDPYRELRAMILVDEAHQFLNKDFNSFRNIISEGRMFGVGMILSTQNVRDFKTSKEDYSQFILSWVIHHVNSISKAEIANIFGASDPNSERYIDFINKAKLFESVCKIGSRVEGIRDLPFFELMKQDERFKPKELSL
jgi:DNA phosphorothioation-dependent restriction protein DptH